MNGTEKFTPGPWRACAVKGGWDGVEPVGESVPICNLVLNNPANAQLIAAAPDLYEIIERMTYEIAGLGGIKATTFTEALALLRKARGEA